MFRNFFYKLKLHRLQKRRELLLRKSFEVSKIDRSLSDQYLAQANKVEDDIKKKKKRL